MRPAPITRVRMRDVSLAGRISRRRARATGIGLRIIVEARRNGLAVSEALAIIEHESGFRNIFGCDAGAPFCHEKVTKRKVMDLVRHVHNGGTSNGVGHGQLTWIGYIEEANRDGGAWVPRVNIATSLHIFGALKKEYGWMKALEIYNAGHVGTSQGRKYAQQVDKLQNEWHRFLT